jgi:hypothetical protein
VPHFLSVNKRPTCLVTAKKDLAELVKYKNETSTARCLRKRIKAARKKLYCAIKEQRRYAKSSGLRAVSATLTFANNSQFEPKHISRFLDMLRRALKTRGARLQYVWTIECAARLHYHLLLWLPRDFKLPLEKMSKWWPYGSSWLENCRSPSAWLKYIAKFDSPPILPKGTLNRTGFRGGYLG